MTRSRHGATSNPRGLGSSIRRNRVAAMSSRSSPGSPMASLGDRGGQGPRRGREVDLPPRLTQELEQSGHGDETLA